MIDRVSRSRPLSVAEFNATLATFGDRADAEAMIGGSPGFGAKAWIWVSRDGALFHLNADSKGEGVSAYLRLVAQHGPALAWSVVANNRGKINKVAFGPEKVTLPGFYLYRADA